MAKPICVIKVDDSVTTISSLREVNQVLQEKMPDYHVFALPQTDREKEGFEFQVFYDKDFTETNYEQLKGLINSSLKEQSK